MKFGIARVVQATVALAFAEWIISTYPSGNIHFFPSLMYIALNIALYFVVISVAAFVATRLPATAIWVKGALFAAIVMLPSTTATLLFFYDASSYSLGGKAMIINSQLTAAGLAHLGTTLIKGAALAFLAAIICLRRPEPRQDQH